MVEERTMADPSAELAPPKEFTAVPSDETRRIPDEVTSICLSGGGYRAMLFHTGALWRLHQTGLLPKIGIFSSVSGGSIANGWLALNWDALKAPGANFEQVFVAGMRQIANTTIDVWAVLGGVWNGSIAAKVAAAYDRVLFNGRTLQQLPDAPEFIYDSSNLQSGALWRFAKEYMGDYKVGYPQKPAIPLSVAVGASSAFPPVLSPVILHPPVDSYRPVKPAPAFEDPAYRARVVLADGGVYDNLGLEPVIKRARTVLVSDGGSPFQPKPKPSGFWPVQIIRVLMCEDNQVRGLRKRDLIARYQLHQALETAHFDIWGTPAAAAVARKGTYWGITTHADDYKKPDGSRPAPGLPCPADKTEPLAHISTRLARMKEKDQEHLINWGYAVCDYAIRTHLDPNIPPATKWPYARGLN
jgi:NTE family protein